MILQDFKDWVNKTDPNMIGIVIFGAGSKESVDRWVTILRMKNGCDGEISVDELEPGFHVVRVLNGWMEIARICNLSRSQMFMHIPILVDSIQAIMRDLQDPWSVNHG